MGIKSSAVSLGPYTRPVLSGLALMQYGLMELAAYNAGVHTGLFVYSIFAMQAYQIWNINHVKLDSPQQCMRMFETNRWLGSLPFLAIVLSRMHGG